ncbi:hypothetical protein N9496_02295 [Akkermansiaceae bacterium]|nr:hypothetical protein [Akkermansiaceae bacterium]
MRFLAILITLTVPISAQVYSPSNGNGNGEGNANANANGDGNSTANGSNNSASTTVERKNTSTSVYGNELPFVDPTQETITIMGHTFGLGDNRLGGMFESYLADSPNTSEDALEYRATIDSILKAVSPYTKNVSVPQKIRDGFSLLPRAATYSGDGRICDSLSNAIYAAMLSKGTVKNSKQYIADLEKEKKRIVAKADWMRRSGSTALSSNTKLRIGQPRNQNSDAKQAPLHTESYRIQEMQRRILEIETLKKTHQGKSELSMLQARIEYQALLAQLFIQRRFEHVIIGTRFYNLIFQDGSSKMHLKKDSDVNKFFTEGLGVEPTVTGLDSAANEAMRKAKSLVKGFQNHLEYDELHSASKRLTEAYAIGEFLPVLQIVPAPERRIVLEYVRSGNDLIKAMDVRDYTQAKIILEALKKRSSDFDSTKAEGAIAAFTRASNGHIRSAQIALINGDQESFQEELKKATQVWPTNPKLDEIDKRLDSLLEDSDMAKTLADDFDRLLSEDNFREIFDRRFEFVPVVKDDTSRKDAIEQIVRNITRIDGTISLAEVSSKNGNNFAAWEALAELRDEFPKDPELLQRLEKLSSKVADFTVALSRAKEFEDNDLNPQTGSALSWYMQAKSIYPSSEHAQEGIDRLSKRIMPDEREPAEASSGSPFDEDMPVK